MPDTTLVTLSTNWIDIKCVKSSNFLATFGLSAVFPSSIWYSTGRNDFGQLGVGDTLNKGGFTRIPGNFSHMAPAGPFTLAISANTTKMYVTGILSAVSAAATTQFETSFVPLTGNWTDVVAGDGYVFALSANTNQRWLCTGANLSGQLGLGDLISRTVFTQIPGRWSLIVPGVNNTFALSSGLKPNNDRIWHASGANKRGELGIGTSNNVLSFTEINDGRSYSNMRPGSGFTVAISGLGNDVKLYGTGANINGQLGRQIYTDITSFTLLTGDFNDAFTGIGHTVALSGFSIVLGTGYNNEGQLGLGDTLDRYSFNLIGNYGGCLAGPYSTYTAL